jgi:hypothetical protein
MRHADSIGSGSESIAIARPRGPGGPPAPRPELKHPWDQPDAAERGSAATSTTREAAPRPHIFDSQAGDVGITSAQLVRSSAIDACAHASVRGQNVGYILNLVPSCHNLIDKYRRSARMTRHSRVRLRLVAARVGPVRATRLPPRKAMWG